MNKFAYYYDSRRNKQDAFYPGIPLRSLTQEDYDALSPAQQETVKASPWWRTREPDADEAPVVASTSGPTEVAGSGPTKIRLSKAEPDQPASEE